MPRIRQIRVLPAAGLGLVAMIAIAALADLFLSAHPPVTSQIVDTTVAVLGFAATAAGFLGPRMRKQAQRPHPAFFASLPAVVPTGSFPAEIYDRQAAFERLWLMLRKRDEEFIVLTGMGGVGKSTIAAVFAGRVKKRDKFRRPVDVWFVPATDPASLTGTLATVARDLGGSAEDVEAIGTGTSDGPDRLWNLLEHAKRRWLLVFDEADDAAALARPLPAVATAGSPGSARTGTGLSIDGTGWIRPTKRGLIVVTSRNGDPHYWGRHATIIPIEPLEEADAVQFLLRQAPQAGDAADARVLAVSLGGLPLALRAAASYLNAKSAAVSSFHDYEMELLMTPAPELRTNARDRDIPVRTFEVSLDSIGKKGVPEASPLLRLMSCYACPAPIPRDILTPEALVTLFGPDGGTRTRHKLERALEELGNHSLIAFRQAADDKAARPDIVVHQVVAEANREYLRSDGDNGSQAEVALIRRAAVDLIVGALDQLDSEKPEDWPQYFRLGPHLHALFRTVAEHLDTAGLLGLLRVTTTAALAHSFYGAVAEANRLAQAVLDRLNLIPEDDLTGANIRHEVAWFLVMWRRPQEAHDMYSAVLRVRMSVLGPDDPETLRTRHELGWQAACEGLWAKAEESYRNVLAARRRVLDDLDPETLISRHELGWVIANQGRAAEAEAILTDVLTHRRTVLGDDHPRTLWTRHELAWTDAFQGRWAEAETMYRDILKVRQRVLRIDHPDIFTTLHELAWVVSAQGRIDEARKLYAQALTARLALFGPDSPDTAATREAIDGLGDGKAVRIMVPRHFA